MHRDGEPKPTDGQDAPRNRSFFAMSPIARLKSKKPCAIFPKTLPNVPDDSNKQKRRKISQIPVPVFQGF